VSRSSTCLELESSLKGRLWLRARTKNLIKGTLWLWTKTWTPGDSNSDSAPLGARRCVSLLLSCFAGDRRAHKLHSPVAERCVYCCTQVDRGFSKCPSGWHGVKRVVTVVMLATYRIGSGKPESQTSELWWLCGG